MEEFNTTMCFMFQKRSEAFKDIKNSVKSLINN